MKATWIGISIVVLLTACSQAPQKQLRHSEIDRRWQSLLPEANSINVAEEDLFSLPAALSSHLDQYIKPISDDVERYAELRRWLYDRFVNYGYSAYQTASATQLLTDRNINCLSFSILFTAAARYVDLPAEIQLVYAPPFWDESAKTWLVNQHVNVVTELRVRRETSKHRVYQEVVRTYSYMPLLQEQTLPTRSSDIRKFVFDLNPAIISVPYSTRILSDNETQGLFYSNKSVQALLNNSRPKALSYVRLALTVDRYSATAWNNVGILYNRMNDLTAARESFELSLLADPELLPAKSNLARILRQQGESEAAAALETEIEQYRQSNPYHHFAMGEKAFSDRRFQEAIAHFEAAIERKHNEHEFYYALARAEAMLGHENAAQTYLQDARMYAQGTEKARYSKKLQLLAEAIASESR